jgi:hypothetical protein
MQFDGGRLHLLALIAASAFSLLIAPVQAAAPDAEAQATLDRSVRFLQEAQNADGGFGGSAGASSDPDFSAWAAYALAAAGINPQDQARLDGADVFAYLTDHTEGLVETTDFDRVALVALAAGTSPDQFGSVDPMAEILTRQLPDGSFPQQAGGRTGWVNATVWSIFPLSALDDPESEAAVQRAGEWLLGQQRPDGSWGATLAGSPSESDMTGAAIQALVAAGFGGGEAMARSLDFLRSRQGEDGGFREFATGATNSPSTAWVVQGIWAAGGDPRSWRTQSGADPLSFLASLQHPDGSIAWTASQDLNPLWMTAQAGPALAGMTYPLPAAPRAVRPAPVPAAVQEPDFGTQPVQPTRGHGGKGVVEGDGVIAGGGGRGAPLFSGPQPQSTGSTPHGPRSVGASSTRRRGGPNRTSDSTGGDGEPAPVADVNSPSQTRGRSVEGALVAAHRPGAEGAPGLFAADRGGRPEGIAGAALALAVLAAGAVGWRRERWRFA